MKGRKKAFDKAMKKSIKKVNEIAEKNPEDPRLKVFGEKLNGLIEEIENFLKLSKMQ